MQVREQWVEAAERNQRIQRQRRRRAWSRVKRMTGEDSGEDKIVNGYETDAQPWLASFVRRDSEGALSIACGGALINRRYVM